MGLRLGNFQSLNLLIKRGQIKAGMIRLRARGILFLASLPIWRLFKLKVKETAIYDCGL